MPRWTRRHGGGTTELDDEDRDRLAALRRGGRRPSTVTEVVHVLSLPTLDAVRGAARRLRSHGCVVEYGLPSGLTDDWRLAARLAVDGLTERQLSDARQLFETLAGDFGGRYVGWSVPSVIDLR